MARYLRGDAMQTQADNSLIGGHMVSSEPPARQLTGP